MRSLVETLDGMDVFIVGIFFVYFLYIFPNDFHMLYNIFLLVIQIFGEYWEVLGER